MACVTLSSALANIARASNWNSLKRNMMVGSVARGRAEVRVYRRMYWKAAVFDMCVLLQSIFNILYLYYNIIIMVMA
jgi:hypothetical protein